MDDATNPTDKLRTRLAALGLTGFGLFEISDEDCGDSNKHLIGKTGLLIGTAGPKMWDIFSTSDEYNDGDTQPLDRWSKRNLDALAGAFDATAIVPFAAVPVAI